MVSVEYGRWALRRQPGAVTDVRRQKASEPGRTLPTSRGEGLHWPGLSLNRTREVFPAPLLSQPAELPWLALRLDFSDPALSSDPLGPLYPLP